MIPTMARTPAATPMPILAPGPNPLDLSAEVGALVGGDGGDWRGCDGEVD